MTASEQTATPSSSVATTTTTSASHFMGNNPGMAATSTGSSSSSSSIGDLGKLSGAAIIFPNPSGWVLDTLTQKDVHDFMVRFQLANSSVSVQALTWSVDGSRLTELVRAEPADNNGTLFQNPQTGLDRTAILNVRDVVAKYQQELGKPMVVGVEWALDNGAGGPTGYTYSPAFSIVGDGSKSSSDAYTAISKSQYEKSVETVNDSSSSTTTTGGRIAPAPTNSGSLSPPTIGGSSSNHGRSSGGGLSTGAIAGIAVGVGLAALLAAVLAVFFCMRRRRRRDAAAAATASSATDDNAAVLEQKRAEMENLRAYSQSGGGDGAAAPYRDENNNNNNTSSSSRRRSSTAQRGTPRSERSAQGVSQHLVEEGMTEEDIRRLEEEEAHLDSEILRANERR